MKPISQQAYYIVQTIIGKKIHHNKIYYLIKWTDWDIKESTWEPISNLIQTIPKVIQEYEESIKHLQLPVVSDQYQRAISKTGYKSIHFLKQNILKKKQKMIKQNEKNKAKLSKDKNSVSQNKSAVNLGKSWENPPSKYSDEKLSNQESLNISPYSKSADHNLTSHQESKRNMFQKKLTNGNQQTFYQSFTDLKIEKTCFLSQYGNKSFQQLILNSSFQKGIDGGVRSIKFLRKVPGKLIFDLENLYEVTLKDGSVFEMKSSEVVSKYSEEFIKYLQKFIK